MILSLLLTLPLMQEARTQPTNNLPTL